MDTHPVFNLHTSVIITHILENTFPDFPPKEVAETGVEIVTDYRTHMKWWRQFFARSELNLSNKTKIESFWKLQSKSE